MRQRLESGEEIAHPIISRFDPDPPAELLQHVNAGSPVLRVDHEVYHPVWFEHAGERSESHIGIRQMMEDTGADDLIETHPQVFDALDGQVVNFEIVEFVLALERLRAAHARGAEVDAGDTRTTPPQGMLRCLRGAAAGNQDGEIISVGVGGPEEMVIGAASLRVLPVTLIGVEAVDWRWVGKPLVEVLNGAG